MVFLFAACGALVPWAHLVAPLAASAHLAALLVILVAAALVVELVVDGSDSTSLRRFGTRCGELCPSPLPLSSGADVLSLSRIVVFPPSLFW